MRVPSWAINVSVAVATALLLLTYATAAIGSANPSENFSTTFFWVIVWIGIPFSALLFGNFWERINPLISLGRLIDRKVHTRPYPTTLGLYPALAALAAFTWLELVLPIGHLPKSIAVALTVYLCTLVCGLVIYGSAWVRNAEFLTVISRIIGSVSPLHWKDNVVRLYPPGAGLLSVDTTSRGFTPFILFFIAGVTYDGIKETELWNTSFESSHLSLILGTLELLVIFLALFGAYYGFMLAVKKISLTHLPLSSLVQRFSISLIPVAIAYTVAHYLSYFINTGQNIIPLISDPFGSGLNLFGTIGYISNIAVLPLKTVWYIQVAVVIVGHAIGLYVAHRVALNTYRIPSRAMKSQYPMLVLMIGLTSLALWILHAPLGAEVG